MINCINYFVFYNMYYYFVIIINRHLENNRFLNDTIPSEIGKLPFLKEL